MRVTNISCVWISVSLAPTLNAATMHEKTRYHICDDFKTKLIELLGGYKKASEHMLSNATENDLMQNNDVYCIEVDLTRPELSEVSKAAEQFAFRFGSVNDLTFMVVLTIPSHSIEFKRLTCSH